MFDGKDLELSLQRGQRAAEIGALIRGFREKKPNLRRILRDLTGEKRPVALEGLEQLIAESHARVDPEIRRKQLEDMERNREN